jgi:hypothetical protein
MKRKYCFQLFIPLILVVRVMECNEWFKNNQFNSSLSKVNNCRKKTISVEKVVKSNRFARVDLAAGFTLWEIKDVKCDVNCPSFVHLLFAICPSFVRQCPKYIVRHLSVICPSFVRHLSIICPSFVRHLSVICPSFLCQSFVQHLSAWYCLSFVLYLSDNLLKIFVCQLYDNVQKIFVYHLSVMCLTIARKIFLRKIFVGTRIICTNISLLDIFNLNHKS